MEQNKPNAVKYTVKNSLFTDLFSFPEYVLDLYHTLHPEDTDSTEADISNAERAETHAKAGILPPLKGEVACRQARRRGLNRLSIAQ